MSQTSRRKISEVHHYKIPKRTEGDGMEEDSSKSGSDIINDNLLPALLSQAQISKNRETAPMINGKIHLIPKNVSKKQSSSFVNISFSKEPKFVPFEPYKAAVNPIIPREKSNQNNKIEKHSKMKTEHEHIPIMPDIKSVNLCGSLGDSQPVPSEENDLAWNNQKASLDAEISTLKANNHELENQLKFQTQVNGELKKLLVAAVGEDIEIRVQLLTEDKLHLAKQLLKTATCLSTHQEQIEWLAGQYEVWRSKFLASSVLVEDLAKWKAGLCQKVTDYQNVLRNLLDERNKMKADLIDTYKKLTILRKNFDLNPEIGKNIKEDTTPPNMVNCCATNLKLTDILMAQLLGTPTQDTSDNSNFDISTFLSDAERRAEQLLMQPMISFEKTDIACSAVMMGASVALSSSSPHCSHCNGTVKTI